MNKQYLSWVVGAILASGAFAAPTRRPLPMHLANSNPDFELLRDHRESKKYYAVPKKYYVSVNSLLSFGNDADACESVVSYDKAVKTLVEARQEHAQTTLLRFKQVNSTLNSMKQATETALELMAKRGKLELELIDSEAKGETKESERLKKAIAAIERIQKGLESQSTTLDKLRKTVEEEQTQGLEQISKLEKSLVDFENKVVRPAGRVEIRASVGPEFTEEGVLAKRLDLLEGETVELAQLAGISLSPKEASELGFRDQLKKEEMIGVFKPEWNIRPVEAGAEIFGHSTLPQTALSAPFPKELQYQQVLSLYSFCALSKLKENKKQLLIPLRAELTIAAWQSALIRASGSELTSFRRVLDPVRWDWLAQLPAAETTKDPQEDLGAPSLYSERGVYQPIVFSPELSSSVERRKDE